MIFWCPDRSMSCICICRTGSSYSRWEQVQQPTVRHDAESERIWTLIIKWDVSIKSLPKVPGILAEQEAERIEEQKEKPREGCLDQHKQMSY